VRRSWCEQRDLRADGDDLGTTISFEVTPVALTGVTTGLPVASAGVPVVAANTAPTASAVSITGVAEVGRP